MVSGKRKLLQNWVLSLRRTPFYTWFGLSILIEHAHALRGELGNGACVCRHAACGRKAASVPTRFCSGVPVKHSLYLEFSANTALAVEVLRSLML